MFMFHSLNSKIEIVKPKAAEIKTRLNNLIYCTVVNELVPVSQL